MTGVPSADEVREALRAVSDPELGLNIVDLGLIYDVDVDGATVTVRYTLTTMACGLGPMIESGIKEIADSLPFDDVRTELVFEPPWSPERISADGKAFLGI
ncbi:MAG TPA: metal-sulfur cluster assembly factor [Acidimicrobiia bacterium]